MKKLISLTILFFFSFNILFVNFALANESRSAAIARMTARADYEARPIGLAEYQEWIGTLHDLGVMDYAGCTRHLYEVLGLPNTIKVMSDSEMYKLAEAESKAINLMSKCGNEGEEIPEDYVNGISDLVADDNVPDENSEEITDEQIQMYLAEIKTYVENFRNLYELFENEQTTLNDLLSFYESTSSSKRKETREIDYDGRKTIDTATISDLAEIVGNTKAGEIYSYVQQKKESGVTISELNIGEKAIEKLNEKYKGVFGTGEGSDTLFKMNSDELCEKYSLSGKEAMDFFSVIHSIPNNIGKHNIENILDQFPIDNKQQFIEELFATEKYHKRVPEREQIQIDEYKTIPAERLGNITPEQLVQDANSLIDLETANNILKAVNDDTLHYLSMEHLLQQFNLDPVTREEIVLSLESIYGFLPAKENSETGLPSDVSDAIQMIAGGIATVIFGVIASEIISDMMRVKPNLAEVEYFEDLYDDLMIKYKAGDLDTKIYKNPKGNILTCKPIEVDNSFLHGEASDSNLLEIRDQLIERYNAKKELWKEYNNIKDALGYDVGNIIKSWQDYVPSDEELKRIGKYFKDAYYKSQDITPDMKDFSEMTDKELLTWLYDNAYFKNAEGRKIYPREINIFMWRYSKLVPGMAVVTFPDIEGGEVESLLDPLDPFYEYIDYELGRYAGKVNDMCKTILDYYNDYPQR